MDQLAEREWQVYPDPEPAEPGIVAQKRHSMIRSSSD